MTIGARTLGLQWFNVGNTSHRHFVCNGYNGPSLACRPIADHWHDNVGTGICPMLPCRPHAYQLPTFTCRRSPGMLPIKCQLSPIIKPTLSYRSIADAAVSTPTLLAADRMPTSACLLGICETFPLDDKFGWSTSWRYRRILGKRTDQSEEWIQADSAERTERWSVHDILNQFVI